MPQQDIGIYSCLYCGSCYLNIFSYLPKLENFRTFGNFIKNETKYVTIFENKNSAYSRPSIGLIGLGLTCSPRDPRFSEIKSG